MTYSKKKNHLIEGPFFKSLDIEPQIRKKPLEIKKNTFAKIVLEISSQSINIWGIAYFKNHRTLNCTGTNLQLSNNNQQINIEPEVYLLCDFCNYLI
jgi:hypothetical protein